MKFLIIVLLLLLDLFLLVLYGASGHKIKTTDIETIKYFFIIFFNFFAILVLIFDKKLSKKVTLFMSFLLQVEFIYMMFLGFVEFLFHKLKNIILWFIQGK